MEQNQTFEDIEFPSNEPTFPEGYRTTPGLDELFEKKMSFWEFNILSDKDLIKRGAYFSSVKGEETFHSRICKSTENILSKKKSKTSSEYFKKRKFSTGYATHGLFPYRGKFHPQMIKALLNITGIKPGETVLDPMCGSGTLNVEASLIGINSIGLDKNPFASFMAKVKTESLKLKKSRLKNEKLDHDEYAHMFANQSFNMKKLMKEGNTESKITRLFLLAYLDAIGYSRRVNAPVSKLFPKVYRRYFKQVMKFLSIRSELNLQLGQSDIRHGNAMDMDIETNSIDGIITSPPYSFAIDYVYNDRPQIMYLGYDTNEIKKETIGLRGKSKNKKLKKYFEDMGKVLDEIARVLKPQKFLTLIIGSNTNQTGGVKLDDNIISSAEEKGLKLIKNLDKPIKGIRNKMKKEQVLIFKKTPNKSIFF